MDRVNREMDLQRIRRDFDVSGKGITIAVLDTGVSNHPDLKGKTLCFRDFIENKKDCYDDNGHGSHICGIICGNGNMSRGRCMGVAPGVNLVVGKVLDKHGGGTVEYTLRGLEWILDIQKTYGIRILNLSLGIADLKDYRKKKLLQKILDQCWDRGILVVTAAGNHCQPSRSKSLSGRDGKPIIVGTKEGGPCMPDIISWGSDILSCDVEHGYIRKSGSSMATPIVSGCGALLMEKNGRLSNTQIKERMKATATDLGIPWQMQGWGMINLRKLLT